MKRIAECKRRTPRRDECQKKKDLTIAKKLKHLKIWKDPL